MGMPNQADRIQSVSAGVRQRWAIIGPLLMAAVIIAIEVLSRAGYKVPNAPAILILLVVFFTFTGGMLAGLISGVLDLIYISYFFSINGQLFHYTSESLVRVAVWIIIVPAMVFMVGYLRHRAERAAELAARNATLEKEAGERQRAMETVLREKDFSESVINSLPGVFYLFDHTGKFLRWNRHLEYVSGYSPEEIARMHPLDFIASEDKELVGRKIQEAFTKGVVDVEAHLVTRDGMRIPNYFTGVRIIIDDAPCLIGMGVDITERKRAEDESRLMQVITLAVSESGDLNSALEVVLRKVCEATGWILGEAWTPHADRAVLEISPAYYCSDSALEKFRVVSASYTFASGAGIPGRVWKSRQPVWIKDVTRDTDLPRASAAREIGLKAAMGIPVLAGEEVVAVLVFFMRESRKEDERQIQLVSAAATQLGAVMQRKRAEEVLRVSESRLRAIVDAEPECVKIMTADGELVQMNAAGLAMLEVDRPEQVIGKSLVSFVAPEYREAFRTLCEDVLQGKKARLEFEIIGLKGTRRWLDMHAVPLANEKGGAPFILSITRDITERKQNESRLSYLAHYDSLTNLPNRVLLTERMKEAMAAATLRERLVAIIFLDLDRFKYINDSLGHEEGDTLLKEVAVRVSGAVRRGDTVARLSGDEFAFVLADMGHVDDAHFVAQKILDVFRQPFHIVGRELFVTASLGITLYPFDDRDAQGLLRNADVAMYHAKASGKNNYQFYAAEMTAKATEWLSLENDLRNALPRNELSLHYQPIADCRTGRLLGMEALLRWKHPECGMISPAQFIPLAEETGLIASIGEWVLRTACAQCHAWQQQGHKSLYVAVNLSARQFLQKNLAASIQEVLRETGLDAANLGLELTEGLIMQQAGITATILRELKAMNIRISIDDFGTGYSSLSYLKRFPIDVLKIDQSFVRDIPGDPDDMAIAATIITMAHSLGMKVVAEGVETEQQLKFMRENACDAMQGYYLSKPLPAEQFEMFLKNGSRLATG
jgi:diguanylate cyclase (GGDEF)-like protein/PAS domain S-box-containing protein